MAIENHKLSFLFDQCSTPARDLILPAPTDEQLNDILQAAMSVPDHGELTPFRFLIIEGDARMELAPIYHRNDGFSLVP